MPPPLALTLGEPAGIGPDIALAAWRDRTAPAGYLLLSVPAHSGQFGAADRLVGLGISIFPDNGQTKKELEIASDRAMYAAKKAGKNGYMFSAFRAV